MVITPDSGAQASVSASEAKQTCRGPRRIRPLALWRLCGPAGHLHNSEHRCSEHRFMQDPGRNSLEHASISVRAGVPAAAGGHRFCALPREQQQCAFESHDVSVVARTMLLLSVQERDEE